MIQFPMTKRGRDLLQEELDNLTKVEREEIITAIAEARALGDLKENAEYHAAKEKQSHIEGRIKELQAKLGAVEVIDNSQNKSSKIIFGAYVKITNSETLKSQSFQLVGEDESISTDDKTSYKSPLGRALIGKEEGDEVTVKAPKGDIEYIIDEVSYK